MRVSLVKDDPSLTLGETLVHVEVSEIDDPPAFEYSHSFKYKVPSGTDKKGKPFGEIIVYTDKNASGGSSFSFELQECRNKDCKKEGCPVAKPNRLLVADVFHTKPKWLALQEFGAALFRALFSGYAGQLLQKTKPRDPNGRIYLQLNSNDDLDAIPWEYANNHTKFLVHQRIFTRIQEHPRNMLLKYPLRIIAVVPDPVVPPGEPGADLPDLHLNEQFRNFINGFTKNKKAVKLERVFPPTVQQMELQLMKERETATVLHFMGHCVQKGTDGPRALIFEHNDNGGLDYVDAPRLVSTSDNLRLAFISACDSRDIARVLVEHGIPYVIGSNCPIPDDLARKFEQEFYKFLTGGSTVEKAMGQARVSLRNSDDIRHSYFAGAMVLYSSISGEDDGVFECEDGDPNIQLHEPPHNLTELPTALSFRGHRKELSKLYTDLKRMVKRGTQISHAYTVKGISGPEFIAEAMKRMAHLFPGGVFAWTFDKERTSALGYFERLVDVMFSPEVGSRLKEQSGNDDEKLGSAIIQQFQTHATCLLVLDQADILDLGRKRKNLHAENLGIWLEKVSSVRDTVKILLISQKPLVWLKGELMDLNDSNNPSITRREDIDSYFEYYASTINNPRDGKHFYGVPGENYGFVDRPKVIQEMQDVLNTNSPSGGCRILALKGLGGIGKTQLMLRYCYLHAAEYDIFWLTVDSWDTAVHAYCKLAGYLGLDEAVIKEKGSERKVIDWVLSWFAGRTKWLLLLDNADGEMSQRIFELLPRKGGNIIFTTRQPIPRRAMVISVDKMQVQEAIPLLYNVSSMDLIDQKNADFNYAQEIVTEFDCLPLAVNLARAYVQQTGISLGDYLRKFRKQREHKKLLGYKDETDSDQYKYTVATVWQLSFERIKALNFTSAQILEASTFLHPENIPTSFLTKQYAALELKSPSAVSPNEQDNEENIGKAITVLADFSFMSRIKSDDEEEVVSLAIHRLVQKVIYDSMAHEQRLGYAGKIIAALAIETYFDLDLRKSYSRKIIEAYLPHIRHLAALINELEWKPSPPERLMDLLRQVSYYVIADEKEFGYEELLQTAIKAAKATFGVEHKYTLQSQNNLASLYMGMGKYSEAEALFRQVLAIHDKTPDETSNDLVVLLNNLALLCKSQGNFKEAESHYLRILKICESSGSPLTALILNNLGEFYISLGNYDKAEEVHKRALTIRENEFGRDNVVTAESLNNLAVLYEIRGNYGESERLQKRALEIREKELGPENTNTATSMTNLAVIHMFRGKYNEAEPLFQKALVTFKKVCGPAHPRTATRQYFLAVLYENQGKFREAMPIAQEALDIRKDALGPEHPDTVQSLNNLGNIYYGLGKHDEAEKLYNQALSICQKTLRLEHPDTATALHGLASLCNDQGKYDKAEPLYQRALAIREKVLPEHPDTATSLDSLASLCKVQGKYDEAEPLNKRAQAIKDRHANQTIIDTLKGQRKDKDNAIVKPQKQIESPAESSTSSQQNLDEDIKVDDGITPAEPQKQIESLAEPKMEDDHQDTRVDINSQDDERGANVNAEDDNRGTPLHIAAKNGHIEKVRRLAEQGADVNAKDHNGRTPLHLATESGLVDLVKLLVAERRADVNVKDHNGRTPLHLATESGLVDLVKLLVADFGADHKAKDNSRQTPLHMVVDSGDIEVVKLLVELGADINCKDCEGRTPLHIVAERGCVELIRPLVVELNMDANAKDNKRRTPLDYLVKRGHADLVRPLVDELLAKTNAKDKNEWIPLHLVAASGHFDVVELLAGNPCDVQAKDKNGWTPLHLAANGGHLNVVQFLLDKFNADIKVKNKNGWTPLHNAAAGGHAQVVKLLVTIYKADVNVEGMYKLTPLHLAAANGHMEVVWLLGVEFKADVNAKSETNMTPLDLATSNGHFEVAGIIQTVLGGDTNTKII